MLAAGGPVAIAHHQLVAIFDVLDGVVERLAIGADGVESGVVLGIAVVPLRGRILVPSRGVETDGQFALGSRIASG